MPLPFVCCPACGAGSVSWLGVRLHWHIRHGGVLPDLIVECHAKERELKKENIQIKYAGMAKTGDVTTHPKFRLNRKTKPSMIIKKEFLENDTIAKTGNVPTVPRRRLNKKTKPSMTIKKKHLENDTMANETDKVKKQMLLPWKRHLGTCLVHDSPKKV